MDHDEALRLQAAVKYVLGELPEVERDSFEEHYFDCGECALDVRAAAAFADNARNVLCHEAREAALHAAAPGSRRWLAWFKPIVAVPAFAALVLIIAYQNAVTIPEAKKEAGSNAAQFFSSSFSLQMANTRGGEEVKVQVHPNESFALSCKPRFPEPASTRKPNLLFLQGESSPASTSLSSLVCRPHAMRERTRKFCALVFLLNFFPS